MKTLSLRLPDEIAQALAAIAIEERRSFNSQIIKALEEWLDSQKK